MMKPLNETSQHIMQILWRRNHALVEEIVAELPLPKPSLWQTRQAIRGLRAAKLMGCQTTGRKHGYYPLVSEKGYKRYLLNQYLASPSQELLLLILKAEKIDFKDTEAVLNLINQNKNRPV